MPDSLSLKVDSSDSADPAGRNPASGDRRIEGLPEEHSGTRSQRVRELPPPPKASDLPRLPPRIEAAPARPGGWRGWWSQIGRRQSSSCVVSFVFHFLLLLGLALVFQIAATGNAPVGLIASTDVPEPLAAGDQARWTDVLPEWSLAEGAPPTEDRQLTVPRVADPREQPDRPNHFQPEASGAIPVPRSDLLLKADGSVSGALAGRGRNARATLAGQDGGSQESEQAVERGLRWLMAHQREDGSWHFDHRKSPCRGRCGNPGTESSTTAATAIVLLPFLGAGYTHTEGEYHDVVRRGLYHLMNRTLKTSHGNDLQDGTMYAQGLATIVLCEAYAMTKDPALADVAQGAIRFIAYAQDHRGGGWRYNPGEPGDSTVTGWQLMGLKSGQMAGLEVPRPTIYLVHRFLASVQSEDGALYGYLSGQPPRNTTTAVGLLCRMYTGWGRDHPALAKGVAYLDRWGPSRDGMYYNYYATQVMHHWEGPEWERWNAVMRDHLVSIQATADHEAGSWHFDDVHGKIGGRLYNTAMAVMTLEVYYRYMPIYRQNAVEDEF